MQVDAWDSVAQEVNFNLEIDFAEFTRVVSKDATILDYGCGYGRTCNLLKSAGYNKIIGIDTSSEMIKRGNIENPSLSLIHSSELQLKYQDGHFGAIVLCALLTCTNDFQTKTEILAEVYRLLKNGGILHMVEFCSEKEKLFESDFGVVMHHQQPSQLRSLVSKFTELKFEIETVQTMTGKSAKALTYFGQKST